MTTLTGLLLAILWPMVAAAVEITGFDTVDETKKLTITFTFDKVVDAEVIHHYANNFVDIAIAGLKLPRNLTRSEHVPADKETLQFFQSTRFFLDSGTGHIRLQLGKYASPGDVQVVELDDRIVVDLVKPYYKLPKEPAVESTPVVEDPPVEFVPDTEPPAETPEAVEPARDTGFADPFEPPQGLRDANSGSSGSPVQPGTPAADPLDSPVVLDDEPVDDEFGNNSLDDLRTDTDPTADGRPVRGVQPTPSYRNFDLDDVPVAQLQLRNMAFNEALMELTAGSGFNVVVGKGVSDELMTLDFRQKELSLKRALDLLCMAYDLSYTVEDDAVVIKAK